MFTYPTPTYIIEVFHLVTIVTVCSDYDNNNKRES